MAFDACCRKAGVAASVDLFRHYYHIKKTVGGYYFSSRPKRKDFVKKYSEAGVGWRRSFFMVKRENFPAEMCWKESVGMDNRPGGSVNEQDIEKLEKIEGQDMTCFKSTTLEQVGKWKKISEEGSRSRASTGKVSVNFIKNCIKEDVSNITVIVCVMCLTGLQKKNQPI